jgi:hypothetical protein
VKCPPSALLRLNVPAQLCEVCVKSAHLGESSLYDGVSGLALAVVAAEALHLLFVSDSSGLTFVVRSFGRSTLRQYPEGAS